MPNQYRYDATRNIYRIGSKSVVHYELCCNTRTVSRVYWTQKKTRSNWLHNSAIPIIINVCINCFASFKTKEKNCQSLHKAEKVKESKNKLIIHKIRQKIRSTHAIIILYIFLSIIIACFSDRIAEKAM